MPDLQHLIAAQAGVITRRQALLHLTESALTARLGSKWQIVLPGVYCAQTGPLSRRQQLIAGQLFAGDDSMLDDVSALTEYRVRYLPPDDSVRLLVPAPTQRHSRDFVVLRRTVYLPRPRYGEGGIRLAPISRALTDFALRYDDERTVRAVLASAVQRRQVGVTTLLEERKRTPARGRRRLDRVLHDLSVGIRSAPEGDVRRLVATSDVLPNPLYNCLLRLPSGRLVSPDLLVEDAALVHETNGREAHADEDPFDSMQERHDAMTVAGLTVLHNPPRRISREGEVVLAEIEACYRRDAGRGLPPGVEIIRRSAA